MEQEVTKVVTRGGRAVGLRTATGEEYLGKEAVLASIHPKRLERFIDGLDEDLLRRASKVKSSPFNILTAHYAIRHKAEFAHGPEVKRASATEYATTTNFRQFIEQFDPLRRGEVVRDQLMFSGADQTHNDPTRAPPGQGVLLTQAFVPYFLRNGGPQRWDDYKEEVADMILAGMRKYITNIGPENIIARTVDSPLDHERHSPNSFVDGDEHGLGSYMFQAGSNRPIPELANYTVPGVSRLYLCGPFMHPSGGVFGGGRATAIKMFEDLGIDFQKAVGGVTNPRPSVASPSTARAASSVGAVMPDEVAAKSPMTLYGADGKEMMTVSELQRDGDALLIKGRIYGTVPLLSRLQPEEVRKLFGLLNWRMVLFLLSLAFRPSSKQATAPPSSVKP
jgi:hypothetical protein